MRIPNLNRYLLSIYLEPVLKVFKYFNPLRIWSLFLQMVYKKCKICYPKCFIRVCFLIFFFFFLYLKLPICTELVASVTFLNQVLCPVKSSFINIFLFSLFYP